MTEAWISMSCLWAVPARVRLMRNDSTRCSQPQRKSMEPLSTFKLWTTHRFVCLFDRASAMIHFSSEESFGLTFAEAVARGLYLFASDVGGSPRYRCWLSNARKSLAANDWVGLEHGGSRMACFRQMEATASRKTAVTVYRKISSDFGRATAPRNLPGSAPELKFAFRFWQSVLSFCLGRSRLTM